MRASYILGDIVEYFLINNKSFFIPKGNFFFLSYFYEKTADFSTVVFILINLYGFCCAAAFGLV